MAEVVLEGIARVKTRCSAIGRNAMSSGDLYNAVLSGDLCNAVLSGDLYNAVLSGDLYIAVLSGDSYNAMICCLVIGLMQCRPVICVIMIVTPSV